MYLKSLLDVQCHYVLHVCLHVFKEIPQVVHASCLTEILGNVQMTIRQFSFMPKMNCALIHYCVYSSVYPSRVFRITPSRSGQVCGSNFRSMTLFVNITSIFFIPCQINKWLIIGWFLYDKICTGICLSWKYDLCRTIFQFLAEVWHFITYIFFKGKYIKKYYSHLWNLVID